MGFQAMALNKKEKAWIHDHLQINPNEGGDDNFYCSECGLLISKGYTRVVIGDRGPYVEFLPSQIIQEHLIIPPQYHVYFKELQSICPEKIFVYAQLKTVKYADYKKGLIYISPRFTKNR